MCSSDLESYEEENPRAGIVAEYLEKLLPLNWEEMDSYTRREWLASGSKDGTVKRMTVCTLEIWVEALGGNPDRIDRYSAKEIRDILAGMPEWQHQRNLKISTRPYGRQRYYKRRTLK